MKNSCGSIIATEICSRQASPAGMSQMRCCSLPHVKRRPPVLQFRWMVVCPMPHHDRFTPVHKNVTGKNRTHVWDGFDNLLKSEGVAVLLRAIHGKSRLILLGLVLAAVAIWFLLRSGQSPKEIRNVVLISIDTCRADYLSCYGYPRQTTPNIDALAAEGTVFKNTIAPVPIT